MHKKIIFIFLLFCSLYSCSTRKSNVISSEVNRNVNQNGIEEIDIKTDQLNEIISVDSKKLPPFVNDTVFVNLKEYSNDFMYDMKYATPDNFLKSKVYECEACYLRLKTVNALIEANNRFMKKGYRIKLFDCYRPIDIQKKMWQIVSNSDYVANPKKGSIHNRGGAVDITLVDASGKELDMGTSFDYFGIEASHNFDNLSEEVKNNRRLLRKGMTKYDFKIFKSEWWHYNLKNSYKDNLSNFKWKCD